MNVTLMSFCNRILLSAFLLLTPYPQICNAAAQDSFLDTPIDNVTSFFGDEFSVLCKAQNRPCGVEERHCNEIRTETSATLTHMRKTTFRKALDQAVQSHNGYRWTVRDSVVNFEPVKRVGTDLLSRKLDKVSIHGVESSAAFRLVMKQAGISVNMAGTVYSGGGPPLFVPIDLELKDVTVREALNAIAKADGQVLWWYCSDKPEQTAADLGVMGWRYSQVTPKPK
jgi:hypothetical protein